MTSNLLQLYPFSLELVITFAAKATALEKEALWDELVGWLEGRHVFVGGNASCAFVLVTRTTQPFIAKLKRWLEGHLLIRKYFLRPGNSRPLQSTVVSLHNARVEAIFHLQQHLVEQMTTATQAMYFLKFSDQFSGETSLGRLLGETRKGIL
jgi:hypothetical protein